MADRKKPELEIPSLNPNNNSERRGSRFIARRPNILTSKKPQTKDAEVLPIKLNKTMEIVSPRKSTSFDICNFIAEGFTFDTFKSFHDKQLLNSSLASNENKIPSVSFS